MILDVLNNPSSQPVGSYGFFVAIPTTANDNLSVKTLKLFHNRFSPNSQLNLIMIHKPWVPLASAGGGVAGLLSPGPGSAGGPAVVQISLSVAWSSSVRPRMFRPSPLNVTTLKTGGSWTVLSRVRFYRKFQCQLPLSHWQHRYNREVLYTEYPYFSMLLVRHPIAVGSMHHVK